MNKTPPLKKVVLTFSESENGAFDHVTRFLSMGINRRRRFFKVVFTFSESENGVNETFSL